MSRLIFKLFRVASANDTVKINTVTNGEHFTDVAGNLYYKKHDTGQVILIAGANSANSVSWTNLSNKPTTFAGFNVTLATTDIPTLDKSKITFGTGNALSTFGITLASTDFPVMSGLTAGTYTKLTVNNKGQITGSGNLTNSDLPTVSGLTAGTYTKVNVNNKGIITSGGALLTTDIPTLDKSKINFGTGNSLAAFGITLTLANLPDIHFSDLVSPPVTLAGFGIIDAAPIDSPQFTNVPKIVTTRTFSALDGESILTKEEIMTYVQTAASSGLVIKDSVIVATTVNITLSGLQTIDGYSVLSNQRILVKNQTTLSENGIYSADTGAWTRTSDLDASAELVNNIYVFIENGATNGSTAWVTSNIAPSAIINTDDIYFSKFFASEELTGSGGIVKTGSDFSLAIISGLTAGTYTRVTVNAKGQVIAASNLVAADIPTLDKTKITFGTGNSLATFGISSVAGGANSQELDALTLTDNKILTTNGIGDLELTDTSVYFKDNIAPISSKDALLTLVGNNKSNWITRDVNINPPSNQTINSFPLTNILNVITDADNGKHFIFTDMNHTANNISGVYKLIIDSTAHTKNLSFRVSNNMYGLNVRRIKIQIDNGINNSFIKEFSSTFELKSFITIEPGYTYEFVCIDGNYFKVFKIESIFDSINYNNNGLVTFKKSLAALRTYDMQDTYKRNTPIPFFNYGRIEQHEPFKLLNIDGILHTGTCLELVKAISGSTSHTADPGVAKVYLGFHGFSAVLNRNNHKEIITVCADVTPPNATSSVESLTSTVYNTFSPGFIYYREIDGENRIFVNYSAPKYYTMNFIGVYLNMYGNILWNASGIEGNPTKVAFYNTLRSLTAIEPANTGTNKLFLRTHHRFGMRNFTMLTAAIRDPYFQIVDDCGRYGMSYAMDTENFGPQTNTMRRTLTIPTNDYDGTNLHVEDAFLQVIPGVFNKAVSTYANGNGLALVGTYTTYASQNIVPIMDLQQFTTDTAQNGYVCAPNYGLDKRFSVVSMWIMVNTEHFVTVNIGGVLKSYNPAGYVNNPLNYQYIVLYSGHKLTQFIPVTVDTTSECRVLLEGNPTSGFVINIDSVSNGTWTRRYTSAVFTLVSNRWFHINNTFRVIGNDTGYTIPNGNTASTLYYWPHATYINGVKLGTQITPTPIPFTPAWNKLLHIDDGTGRVVRCAFEEFRINSIQGNINNGTGTAPLDTVFNPYLDELALYQFKEANVLLIDTEGGLEIHSDESNIVPIGVICPHYYNPTTNFALSSNINQRRFCEAEPPRLYHQNESEEFKFSNLIAAELLGNSNMIIVRSFFGVPVEVEAWLTFAGSSMEYKVPFNAVSRRMLDSSNASDYQGFSCSTEYDTPLGEIHTIKWGGYFVIPSTNGILQPEVSFANNALGYGNRFNLRVTVTRKFK